MNRIFVSHAKDDKSNAKKLVSKLEADGLKCFISSRNKADGNEKELIQKSNIFILILSQKTESSKEVSEQIKIAVENNCHIIPFRTGSTPNNMTMQYFLHSLEWVDAHTDGFNEAYDILLEIIEDVSGKKASKKNITSKKTNSEGFKITKNHLFGLLGLFAAIIAYLIFFPVNNSSPNAVKNTNNSAISNNNEILVPINTKLEEYEKQITGNWKMIDYEDSRILSPSERLNTEKNIEAMKQRVLIKYNTDKTFERYGFTPKPQKGYWEYNKKKKKIFLTPQNQNHKEEINIFKLTDKIMTIIVNENVTDQKGKTEIVTTKITFEKQ